MAGVGGRREAFVGRRAQPSRVGLRLTESYWGPSELVQNSPRARRSVDASYNRLRTTGGLRVNVIRPWAADCSHGRHVLACQAARPANVASAAAHQDGELLAGMWPRDAAAARMCQLFRAAGRSKGALANGLAVIGRWPLSCRFEESPALPDGNTRVVLASGDWLSTYRASGPGGSSLSGPSWPAFDTNSSNLLSACPTPHLVTGKEDTAGLHRSSLPFLFEDVVISGN